MKSHLLFSLIAVLGLFASTGAQAQSGEGNGGAGVGGRLSFLSADDRAHYLKARQEALDQNPDLKTEQESLNKEREDLRSKGADASDEDRQKLREDFMAHGRKMHDAMLKADPTIAPVLAQVDAKIKEWSEKRAAGNSGN